MADPDRLTNEQREKTKKYSIIDGAAYSVMFGFGEQYVVPFAIRLGATNSQIGILSSVPSFIGSLFQILGAKLTDQWRSRKKIVTFFVFFQALTLLPLFIIPFLTKSVTVLTIIFMFYMIFANIVGPAWGSWMGDIVKEGERAKYFSKRNKTIVTSMMISVLAAGIILHTFDNINIWIGFGILFSVAFIGRIISTLYLSKQLEPKYIPPQSETFSLREFLHRMPHSNFGNFALYRSLMAFSVMIASPFFVVYVLKTLQFSYIQYTAIVLVPMLVKVLTMTYWGKYSERFGSKRIMTVSGMVIAIIPLLWFIFGLLFENTHLIFYLILLAEAISGFAWAGFELTTFNYMLETASPQKRAKAFAYFNVMFGTMVLFGGLIGSWLVSWIPPILGIGTLLIVFLISFIIRSVIAMRFAGRMKEVRIEKYVDENKLFFDLVIAKPWNGALHQTTSMITLAEKGIIVISDKTKDTVETIAEPVLPVIKKIVDFLDKVFDMLEPLRKSIEPEIVKKHKREMYKHLTEIDNEGYLHIIPKEKKEEKKEDNRTKRQRRVKGI